MMTFDSTYTDQTKNYYKIAPGSEAWNWAACRNGGFIGIGWEDLGDISGLSWEEFQKRIEEKVPENEGWTKRGATQVWTFVHLRPGDRIVANRGMSEVLVIGTVTGPYYFVEGVRHGHRLPVQWDDLTRRRINEPGWRPTMVALDEQKFNDLCQAPAIDDSSPSPKTTGYWVFQANPQVYRVVDALKVGVIGNWSVRSHKDQIKPDDKFILWLTGKASGCCALGTVTNPVRRITENPEENSYWVNPTEVAEADRCGVRFDHLLIDNPISREEVRTNPILAWLKVGLQGTNFTATKEEYDELLRLAQASTREHDVKFLPAYPLEAMADETFIEVQVRRVGAGDPEQGTDDPLRPARHGQDFYRPSLGAPSG